MSEFPAEIPADGAANGISIAEGNEQGVCREARGAGE